MDDAFDKVFRKGFIITGERQRAFIGWRQHEKIALERTGKIRGNLLFQEAAVVFAVGDFDAVREARKHLPDITIKLLANHGCYLHCFYGGRHAEWPVLMDAAKAFLREETGRYVGFMLKDGCQFLTREPADEIRRPYLRPEDLTYIERQGWADGIKIAYRKDDSRLLKQKISAYLARSFQGDLFMLAPSNKGPLPFTCDNKAFPKDFIERVVHCGQRCAHCRYCASVARAAITPKPTP